MKPLNGTKTHPLKPAALAVLRSLVDGGPRRAHTINPGVRNRLAREGLAEECNIGPSGSFYCITDAGRLALAMFARSY